MIDQLKGISLGVMACLTSWGLPLQAYQYEYYEMPNWSQPIYEVPNWVQETHEVPNMVQPIYVDDSKCLSPCTGWNAPVRLGVGHTEGRWYDLEIGYTSFNGFLALNFDDDAGSLIPFIDVRGHLFNDGKWAANVGGGLRLAVKGTRNVFGVNGYYDYRESEWRNNFNQAGFGLEFLSPCVDLRFNWYFVLGKTRENGRQHLFNDFIGPFWATCQQSHRAVSGGDLELGTWLVPRAPCRFVNLYAAIIPYYYTTEHKHHSKNKHQSNDHSDGLYGITGRFLTLMGEYFSLELRAGYDRSYKGMVQGTLTFEMPLDKLFQWESWFESKDDCSCDRRDCRGYQPVVRQEIIVFDRKNCCWKSNF